MDKSEIIPLVLMAVFIGAIIYLYQYFYIIPAECYSDADCVPAQCCHPTSCVPKDQAPDCSDMFCTMECAPNTLDCGQGECICKNGKCTTSIDIAKSR